MLACAWQALQAGGPGAWLEGRAQLQAFLWILGRQVSSPGGEPCGCFTPASHPREPGPSELPKHVRVWEDPSLTHTVPGSSGEVALAQEHSRVLKGVAHRGSGWCCVSSFTCEKPFLWVALLLRQSCRLELRVQALEPHRYQPICSLCGLGNVNLCVRVF